MVDLLDMVCWWAWWWACMHVYCGFAVVIKEISWEGLMPYNFLVQWYDFIWISLKSYELDLWCSVDLIEISRCYSLFILWIQWLLFGVTGYTMGPQLECAQWWWNDFGGCYWSYQTYCCYRLPNHVHTWSKVGIALVWCKVMKSNLWEGLLLDT
jgi:hypothetical protein